MQLRPRKTVGQSNKTQNKLQVHHDHHSSQQLNEQDNKIETKTISSSNYSNNLEWWINLTEIFSWMFVMLFYGFYYNCIGEVASWRNVDYSTIVATKYDYMMPLVPELIIPYFLVYLQAPAYVAICLFYHGVHKSLGLVRRFYITQFFVMHFAYILYVAFPVSIESIAQLKPLNGDFLENFTYNFVQNGMSKFCACPSMHVTHTLSMAFIHDAERVPGYTIAWLAAILTFASTVLTRAHFILDVPCGCALAFILDIYLFKPMFKVQAFEYVPIKKSSTYSFLRIIIMILVPSLIYYGYIYISFITGVSTDMVAMLTGF
jgi:hypothetical protein